MRLFLTLWNCWWILLACSRTVVSAATSLPNPLKDPGTCRSDNTTYRICDPNAILTIAGRQAVQQEIELFETYNVTCGQEEVVPVQMGVALVRTVSIEKIVKRISSETSQSSWNEIQLCGDEGCCMADPCLIDNSTPLTMHTDECIVWY